MAKRKKPQVGSRKAKSKKIPPEKIVEEIKITYKQSLFIEQYIENKGNASAAYRVIYGGNDAVCRTEGHRLVTNPNVSQKIEQRRAQIAETMNFTREKWLKILIGQAICDPIMKFEYRCGNITTDELGDAIHGLDCKASDRKAALDELRDLFGFKISSDSGITETTAGRLLQKIIGNRK